MKLYHTLTQENLHSQMKADGFYCYYDTVIKSDTPLGIWCCENPLQSRRACQTQNRQLVTIEIDCRDLATENFGDFLKKNNGNYWIVRERFIQSDRVKVLAR